MRYIGSLKRDDLRVGQPHVQRGDRVGELLGLGRADDRRGDRRLGQHPGERDLRARDAAPPGDLLHRLDDPSILLLARSVGLLREGILLRAIGLDLPVARQLAACKRAPRDDADTLVQALGKHLAFFLAVQQIILRLHRDEARPAVAFGGMLHFGEAPGFHGGSADVARLPGLHDIVQRLHRLLYRRGLIEAVDLKQIDIVQAEPGQAVVDRLEERLAREQPCVGSVPPREERLGGDHHFVALRHVAQCAAGDLLRTAAGIGIRRVEEVDPRLKRLPEEGPARCFIKRPALHAAPRLAVAHAAEADARHLEAGAAEIDIVHVDRVHCRWPFAAN